MIAAVMLFFLFFSNFARTSFAQVAQGVKGEIVSVGIGGSNGKGGVYRAGSWVPVQVRLENRSGQQFVGRLAVDQQQDLDGDKVINKGQKVILQASDTAGRLVWTYFWPRPDDFELAGIKSVVMLDESGQSVANLTTPNGMANAMGIGKKDSSTYRSMRFVVVLGNGRSLGWKSFSGAWGGTEGVQSVSLGNISQLPDDVKGLDAVDVIVWQADVMKPSDIPPDFQLKAMLDWVKAGGHLIISVGTQGQEFLKANARLIDAIPMTLSTEPRQIVMSDLAAFPGCTLMANSRDANNKNIPLIQVQGTIKPNARPAMSGSVVFGDNKTFADHPLAVTGLYGQGAVTMVTIDVGNPEMERLLTEKNWIEFWNQIAGWQKGTVITAAQYDLAKQKDDLVSLPPGEIKVGDSIPQKIDVTDVTQVRILVAFLFLALYWFLAGPVGHLVLRAYRVVHWSWWVFGAMVVTATAVAGAVVFVLHVATYDVRHKTFVMGTVNSDEATVVGFYGVYAPASGHVELRQPEGTGGGINYLVPLCMPSSEDVKPYADPQSYEIDLDHPSVISPIFRSTLKKMQSRWSGHMAGITGSAVYTNDPSHILKGTLTNNSGYDLLDADIVVYRPQPESASQGQSYLFHIKPPKDSIWRTGSAIDLEKSLVLDRLAKLGPTPGNMGEMLDFMGRKAATTNMRFPGVGAKPFDPEEDFVMKTFNRDDMFYFLMDARTPDPLVGEDHREVVRGIGRLTDSTKSLYAAGAMIIAHAGSLDPSHIEYAKSPVPLTVNGKEVTGKGEVLFAWALPVTGKPPEKMEIKSETAAPTDRGAGRSNEPLLQIKDDLEKP